MKKLLFLFAFVLVGCSQTVSPKKIDSVSRENITTVLMKKGNVLAIDDNQKEYVKSYIIEDDAIYVSFTFNEKSAKHLDYAHFKLATDMTKDDTLTENKDKRKQFVDETKGVSKLYVKDVVGYNNKYGEMYYKLIGAKFEVVAGQSLAVVLRNNQGTDLMIFNVKHENGTVTLVDEMNVSYHLK